MKKFLGILFVLVLLLSFGSVGLPSPVLAGPPSEVWVDDTGPSCPDTGSGTQADPYCRIQDGIDAVASPGTVHVAAGTYYENITLKDGVEVLGAGAGVTTINGGGSGSVVTTNNVDSTTKLDGFTVSNGNTSEGGGIYNYYHSSPTVTNCVFSNNSATSIGGGMFNYYSAPTVDNCRFSGNSATYNGGGMYNAHSSPTVSNCRFSGNLATYNGGGIYNGYDSSPTVSNCDFSNNSVTSTGGGMHNHCSASMVSNCRFLDNSAEYGGGMYNYDYNYPSPTVTSCRFLNNSAGYGGGMHNSIASPMVTNCIFLGNSAIYEGGGMHNNWYSSPMVANCNFRDNLATSGSGGGIYNYYHSSPGIFNSIFVGNTASMGGAIGADSTCSPAIDYNDVWNNSPNDYSGCSAGPNDMSQDPLFVQPAVGDYHLQSGSLCIDAGTNVGAPTGDIEGRPRPVDGDGDGTATTDMGAYEYMPPPPPYFRYLHSEGSLIDLATPVSTQWHEIWPLLYRHYHLSGWEDNGDGVLSRWDTIDMYEKPDGELRPYHVEKVTITLFLTLLETGEPKYIELEGGYNSTILTAPICTLWHEIHPVFCREYHLSGWEDTNMSGNLTACDYVELTNNATGRVTWWHVEDVATDIVVTIKPPPVGGEAYPVSKASILAHWITVGVAVMVGAAVFALRRHRS